MQSFSDVLALVKEYFQEKVRTNQLTETAYTCWIENHPAPVGLKTTRRFWSSPLNFTAAS